MIASDMPRRLALATMLLVFACTCGNGKSISKIEPKSNIEPVEKTKPNDKDAADAAPAEKPTEAECRDAVKNIFRLDDSAQADDVEATVLSCQMIMDKVYLDCILLAKVREDLHACFEAEAVRQREKRSP
jgi:hypothetical protein